MGLCLRCAGGIQMKQGKVIHIALVAVNAILIIVCAVMYLKTDRTAPEFEFQAVDLIYREDMDRTELFAGITASDRADGDVTDRIVIEKITESQKDSTVIVFYAVSDQSGNVAKTSRLFQAVSDEGARSLMEAGINAELNREREPAGEEGSGEETDGQTGGGQSPQGEPSQMRTASTGIGQPSLAPRSAPSASPPPPPAPAAVQPPQEPAPAQNQEEDANSSAPILTLKVSEVKVNAGQGPAWVDIIGTLSDDVDDYNTLFGNLNVGRYDRNKPGTYPVSVYTEDSDGNKSQSVPLTIVVQ